jgi:hypothetical protein
MGFCQLPALLETSDNPASEKPLADVEMHLIVSTVTIRALCRPENPNYQEKN